MRSLIVVAAAVAVFSAPNVHASSNVPGSPEELRAWIKDGCEKRMERFGRSAVLRCMEQEADTIPRIRPYMNSHPDISLACFNRMGRFGLQAMLRCIENDVEADEAIQNW